MIKYRNLKISNKKRIIELNKLFNKFIKSGFYLKSSQTKRLEIKLAKKIGHKYSFLLSSGTNSIYLALKALNLEPNSEVICPVISWVASANAIVASGHKPVFVDVGLDQNINTNLVQKKITKKTRAILAVHFKGIICDIEKLKKIAKKNNILLIEDVAQAFGAKLNRKLAGSFGDISCYSFNPMKVLKSFGELGAISTNHEKYVKRIDSLQYLGTVNKEKCITIELNSKSDEIHSYLLENGLKYLSKDISNRKSLIKKYIKNLPKNILNNEYDLSKSNGYDYQILVNKRNKLINFLKSKNIETRIKHPLILNDHPAHYTKEKFPVASFIKNHSLSLPLHEKISLKNIKYISKNIKKFYEK